MTIATAGTAALSQAPAIEFPFPDYPAPGTALEVADGIFWVSTPLPFTGLKQVNVWLLRDGDGFTMIDCGFGIPQVRGLLEQAWSQVLAGRPLTRLIVTHFHPDHIGNSGFICRRFGLRPYMSEAEWLTAHLAHVEKNTGVLAQRADFYRRHGLEEELVKRFASEVVLYRDGVDLPFDHRRLRDGDEVAIDGFGWRVMVGGGHSPEHLSLYCPERRILIAGDQILPVITTNVSTWPTEPEFDAVGAFLGACKRFYDVLPADVLVLPSHRWPFFNVRSRIEELARHHADRLNAILSVGDEIAAGDVMNVLFRPGLDGHQIGFAMGEAVGHLNHLVTLGHVVMIEDRAGVRYRRTGSGPVKLAGFG